MNQDQSTGQGEAAERAGQSFPARANELFDKALEFSSLEERAAFLNRACAKDPALRERVDRLLAAHDKAGAFLDQPAAGEPPTVVSASSNEEGPGTAIDRYKLLEKIGEGGFGVVYVAEQREPVKRRVALKILKLGMDTRQVVARFEAERQALALMDHPNIAKVLDAGATETGRPYFVMELVKGIPITKYCDQEKLSTQQRLDLFIKVCHAIQHAHQKGIIHRDIKPSNILVTLHDGVAVPKVIDFGIAKATQGELTDKTVYTQFQQFIGTPAYMSPEQAEMSGLDVDTRSDIYSLGVLLYELLTGSTPFDTKELVQSGLDEMRKIIREREPVRPSTRLTQQGAHSKSQIANQKSQISQIPSDLDWIVMKCLEKDRGRRYETANGVAMDVQRHLNNEAIIARPPSTAYRFQKAWRRNKFAFSAAGAVAGALMVGMVLASWQALRARRAETVAREKSARAMASEAAAREEFEDTRAALQFIGDELLGLASPDRQPDPNVTVRTQLDHASDVLKQRTNFPVKVEASLRQKLGSVYFQLGEYAIAIELLERALELQRQKLGPDHEETLWTMHILGETYWRSGDDDRALDLAREGLQRSRRALGTTNWVTLQLQADEATAQVYAETSPTEETERLLTEAVRLAGETLGKTNELTLRVTVVLAHHYAWRGRYADAQRILEKAIATDREVFNDKHPLMSMAQGTLARTYACQTNFAQAEALDRQVLEARRQVLGTNHPMAVNMEIHLAGIYLRLGQFAAVDETHQRVIALLEEGRLVEARLVVRSLWNLIGQYRIQKEWVKIDQLASAVVAAGRKKFNGESLKVVTIHDEWGRSLQEQGRFAEAEEQFQIVVDVRRNHPHGRFYSATSRLGYCLFKQGKQLDRAQFLLNEGYQGLDKRQAQLPEIIRLEILGRALQRLAEFYQSKGWTSQAAECTNKLTELEQKEGRQLLVTDSIAPL